MNNIKRFACFADISNWMKVTQFGLYLNDDKFLNIPDQDIIDKLWVPVIIFDNTENKYETPLDEKARLIVDRSNHFNFQIISINAEEKHRPPKILMFKTSWRYFAKRFGRVFLPTFQAVFVLTYAFVAGVLYYQ